MFEVNTQMPADGEFTLTLGSMGADILVSAMHPLGQGHMTLHGHLQDGKLTTVEAVFGASHRGDEKLLEQRDFRQGLSLINRHNWLTPVAAEIAYAQACEELMGLTPPPRALALRELVLELQNATGWLQLLAAVEQSTTLLQARESLVELTERITGARLHVSFIRLGGVASDVSEDGVADILTATANIDLSTASVQHADMARLVIDHLNQVRAVTETLKDIEGAIAVTLPKVVRVPVGQAYAECIATTGRVGVWVHSDGAKSPLRVGLRAPSLMTIDEWSRDAIGRSLDDALNELLRLPICYGEIER